jgi:hypothetical protein
VIYGGLITQSPVDRIGIRQIFFTIGVKSKVHVHSWSNGFRTGGWQSLGGKPHAATVED